MKNDFWSCGSCGKSFSANDGKISQNSEHHASFVCGVCANKKIYKIEITFSTDKDLNADQLANLENAILLQIDEPMDYDQNAEDYETSQTTYEIERIK
jgi:predicted metal-binding protein